MQSVGFPAGKYKPYLLLKRKYVNVEPLNIYIYVRWNFYLWQALLQCLMACCPNRNNDHIKLLFYVILSVVLYVTESVCTYTSQPESFDWELDDSLIPTHPNVHVKWPLIGRMISRLQCRKSLIVEPNCLPHHFVCNLTRQTPFSFPNGTN